MRTTSLLALTLAAVIAAVILIWPFLGLVPLSGSITATVTLVNRCPLPDTAFVLRHVPSNRSAAFSNAVARMNVDAGDLMEIQLSGRYPDVRFNGLQQPAEPTMRMAADCSMGERMEGTMGGMREKFGN